MVYRKTEKSIRNAAICARMRAGKARKRVEGESPDYPAPIPELRRTIIIIDYDNGLYDQHQIDLYKTPRIDQYRAVVDGKEWKKRIGFSAVLAGIRKSMPRVRAI